MIYGIALAGRSMPLEREQRIAPRQHDLGADWLNVQRNGDAIAAAVQSLSIFAHKKGRPRWPPEMKLVSLFVAVGVPPNVGEEFYAASCRVINVTPLVDV